MQECIESVQKINNKPYENEIRWEHVIYDDGSDDETPDYCKTHPFPHVRYIRSEDNEGIPVAANKAINMCDSEWIFELDSDDFVPSRTLVNWQNAHLAKPETQWFVCDFYRVDASGRYEFGSDYYGWSYTNCKEVLNAIFSGKHFIQHNVFYRKSLWGRVGKYRETLDMAEDLDMYIRFLLAGEMPVYLPTISHFHRNHSNNISKGVTLDEHKKDLSLLAKIYQNELVNMGVCVDL